VPPSSSASRNAPSPAYLRLRELIIAGSLEPSSYLSEPELAEHLGVSRTPVREALTTLIAEGLAIKLPSNRTIVAPVSIDEVRHVYDIRSRLEGLIARDATLRNTAADESVLERQIMLMGRLSDDYGEVIRIGAEFHEHLVTMSGNVMCANLLHVLRGHVDRYRVFTTREPGRAAQAVDEHRAVFEAVVSGDADRAEAVMRDHIDHAAGTAIEWATNHHAAPPAD
jgi:DNA-binding GntR family transcriptional regulator